MMRRAGRTIAVAACLGLVLVPPCRAQVSPAPADAFIAWARTRAIPVASSGDALARLAKGARVIGIGESSHGTHEFALSRAALTESLRSRMRISAVILESSLVSARQVDRWITGATDSLPDFDRDVSYGWGAQPELRESLAELRKQNLAQPAARRIHFYGMDLPANGGGSIIPALAPAWEYLVRVDPAYARLSRARIAPLAERLSSEGYGIIGRYAALSQPDRDTLARALRELVAHLTKGESRYVKASGRDDFDWALRSATVAMQVEVAARVGWNDASNPRDQAMASNVLWISRRESSRGSVIVWSHNLHVSRAPIGGPVFAGRGGEPMVRSMGQWLAASLGSRYVAIGSAFRASSLDEGPVAPDSASLDAVLSRLGPSFFLSLVPAPHAGAAASWLAGTHPKRVEGGYVTMPLRPSFDAVLFVDSLSASHHP
ncbi:MAG: Erythromycin esterase [Gemmatimonadetes bacterium]|nr:Erythromycin esterase [Gemmatimonadota bacterium]